MPTLRMMLCFLGVALSPALAKADEVTAQSGPERSHLLELYTSEGCSSCPPAENWFSTLRQSPRLWKDIVPVSFHITYWDDLGWTDRLAAPAFTNRQRDYAAAWGATSVYTPEFVLNGQEWRARDLSSIDASQEKVGVLSVTLRETGEMQITFHPESAGGPWQVHAALLGMGVTSEVKAGENGGRNLTHDFVALDLKETGMSGETPKSTLRLDLEKATKGHAAFAVWVNEAGKLTPVQAVGGNL